MHVLKIPCISLMKTYGPIHIPIELMHLICIFTSIYSPKNDSDSCNFSFENKFTQSFLIVFNNQIGIYAVKYPELWYISLRRNEFRKKKLRSYLPPQLFPANRESGSVVNPNDLWRICILYTCALIWKIPIV